MEDSIIDEEIEHASHIASSSLQNQTYLPPEQREMTDFRLQHQGKSTEASASKLLQGDLFITDFVSLNENVQARVSSTWMSRLNSSECKYWSFYFINDASHFITPFLAVTVRVFEDLSTEVYTSSDERSGVVRVPQSRLTWALVDNKLTTWSLFERLLRFYSNLNFQSDERAEKEMLCESNVPPHNDQIFDFIDRHCEEEDISKSCFDASSESIPNNVNVYQSDNDTPLESVSRKRTEILDSRPPSSTTLNTCVCFKERASYSSLPKKQLWKCLMCNKESLSLESIRDSGLFSFNLSSVRSHMHSHLCMIEANTQKDKSKTSGKDIHAEKSDESQKKTSSAGYHCNTCGTTSRKPHTHNVYQCDVCGKIFKHESSYIEHTRVHSGEKPYLCHLCGKGFATDSKRRKHVNAIHAKIHRFHCSLCNKGFNEKQNLETHLRKHTGEKPFSCSWCDLCFYSKSSLKYHTIMKHTEQNISYQRKRENILEKSRETYNNKTLKCDFCERKFAYNCLLVEHTKMVHLKEKRHFCYICNKGFYLRKMLKNHLGTHSKVRPYRCDICGKYYKTKGCLSKHMEYHREQRHFCDICNKGYHKLSSLIYHRATAHTDERPFHCTDCPLRFKLINQLNRHIRKIHKRQ